MAAGGAGTFRRLAAATYDGLLLLAVLMIATAVPVVIHGSAITHASVGAFEYLYRAFLALCVLAYFGSAWTRRGQTLGMKAWGIRVETERGTLPSLPDVARRLAVAAPLYLLALAGLGLLIARHGGWLLVLACAAPLTLSYALNAVTGRGTLHDRLSRTRITRVPGSG
jgi:uncharacterized RDD family membrane protein YckC